MIYIPDGISLSHSTMPQTGELRKDEPHPMGWLSSIGQLLSDLTINLSLGVHEANEVNLSHTRCSKFAGLIRGSAKNYIVLPFSKEMAKKLQSVDGDTYSLMHINAFLYWQSYLKQNIAQLRNIAITHTNGS